VITRWLAAVVLAACSSTAQPARVETAPPAAAPVDAAVAASTSPDDGPDLRDVELDELSARCDRGDVPACTELGSRYRLGTGGAALDFARALAVWTRACDAGGGVVPACSDLAELYLGGRGVAQDHHRAVALLRTACAGGEPSACSFLGLVLVEGLAAPTYPYRDDVRREGVVAWEKACQLGSASSCTNVAGLYEHGVVVPKSAAKARELGARACELEPDRCAAAD
jgi:uncharacterized protein